MPNLGLSVVLMGFLAGVSIFRVVHSACLRHIQSKVTARLLPKNPSHHLVDPRVQFTLALILGSMIVRSIALLCILPILHHFISLVSAPAHYVFALNATEEWLGLAVCALFNGEYIWELLHAPNVPPNMIVHHCSSIFMCLVSCHCGLYDDMGFIYAFGVLILHPVYLGKFLRQAKSSSSYPVWRVGIFYNLIAEGLGTAIPVYILYHQNLTGMDLMIKGATVLALTIVKCSVANSLRKGLAKCVVEKCDITDAVVGEILGMPHLLTK
ncbi:Aste57867_2063 [Aphanomyces stellatus]|uniref:Aste57867_2063 protein n=1 Tax=Aphanomyces stellatus TaxID=120398 RepID=A0A485K7R5_9STRA|nr:hypothetical protein As57867_002059 [Aphanomyces stellatus]VFT79267.1 Aste57867_2063 [Aphanomyces stellatus]